MTPSYRPLLAVAGVFALVGGPMHPDADPSGSLSEELAVMTADPRWVLGHALVAASAVLLAAGLWALHRRGGLERRAARALRVAAAAVSLYVVETLFHMAAGVDSDALAAGDFAPIAGTHLLLASVLYPVSGAALVLLGLALLRDGRGLRRVIALLAVLGGALHASSLPVVMLLPDIDGTPLFAGASVLVALWSLVTGLAGIPAQRPAPATLPGPPQLVV
jgi:cytochrome bd-type quinol oxidase subunit 2